MSRRSALRPRYLLQLIVESALTKLDGRGERGQAERAVRLGRWVGSRDLNREAARDLGQELLEDDEEERFAQLRQIAALHTLLKHRVISVLQLQKRGVDLQFGRNSAHQLEEGNLLGVELHFPGMEIGLVVEYLPLHVMPEVEDVGDLLEALGEVAEDARRLEGAVDARRGNVLQLLNVLAERGPRKVLLEGQPRARLQGLGVTIHGVQTRDAPLVQTLHVLQGRRALHLRSGHIVLLRKGVLAVERLQLLRFPLNVGVIISGIRVDCIETDENTVGKKVDIVPVVIILLHTEESCIRKRRRSEFPHLLDLAKDPARKRKFLKGEMALARG